MDRERRVPFHRRDAQRPKRTKRGPKEAVRPHQSTHAWQWCMSGTTGCWPNLCRARTAWPSLCGTARGQGETKEMLKSLCGTRDAPRDIMHSNEEIRSSIHIFQDPPRWNRLVSGEWFLTIPFSFPGRRDSNLTSQFYTQNSAARSGLCEGYALRKDTTSFRRSLLEDIKRTFTYIFPPIIHTNSLSTAGKIRENSSRRAQRSRSHRPWRRWQIWRSGRKF